MEMQKKQMIRRLLAKFLLVTMLLCSLETGPLANGRPPLVWAAGAQKQTSSDAEKPDVEMLFDDVTPGWQNRLSRNAHLRKASNATPSIASPSEYGIEVTARDGQDKIYVNDNCFFALMAKYKATKKAIEAENEDGFLLSVESVTIPSGGTYQDTTGAAEFIPKAADAGKTYTVHYIVKYYAGDGTWQDVPDTDTTLDFFVAEHNIVIDGVPATAQVRIEKEYKFIHENMSVIVSPSERAGITYELVVDRIEKPANGTYTFKKGDKGFVPKAEDKDLPYNIVYQVIRHYPADRGMPDEVVMTADGQGGRIPLEAISGVTAIGEGVRDTITSDDARISTLAISISDGTGPWDSDNEAGNDMDNTNKIIRTYDTITYTLSYTSVTETGDSYKNARYYYEAYLPLTKEQAQFNTDAMGLMDTTPGYMWEVVTDSNGYQTLKWYYEVNESVVDGVAVYAVPSMGTFQVLVNVYAMKNADLVQPVFTASVVYTEDGETRTSGTFDQPKAVQADEVRVSAAPAYNVQLKKTSDNYVTAIKVHDFSKGLASALNKEAGLVYGQMQGYGITLQLHQENPKKGMKGVELPTGPITFDLEFSSVYKDGANKMHPVDTPLVWSISPHVPRTGIKQRNLPAGVKANVPAAAPYNGIRSGAFTRPASRITECWNGGKWTATQDEKGVHVTVDRYVINPSWFPNGDASTAGSHNAYHAVGDDVTVGCFSAGILYLVVPFGGDSGSSNSKYYANAYPDGGTAGSCQVTVKNTNFHAKSVTGQVAEAQSKTTDDMIHTSIALSPQGTVATSIHYAYSNASYDMRGVDNIRRAGDYLAGTDAQCIGGDLVIQMYMVKNHRGNSESNFLAVNQLMKFDEEALEIDPSKEISLLHKGSAVTKTLYGVKPDGTGWNSDAEMNEANEEDLKYYASLNDLAPGEVCVAVLLETRYQTDYEVYAQQVPGRIVVPFKVKLEPSLAGNVYQTVGVWNAWDRAASTKVMAQHGGVFPSRLDMAVKQVIEVPGTYSNLKKANYKKSSYPGGLYTPGSGGEPWYGDSLYIVPYKARITKSTAQFANSAQTEKKKNYNLSDQQYVADYVLKPYLEFHQKITPPSEFTTKITVTDRLPAGLTYRTDSAVLGGTYQPGEVAGRAGTVTGGTSLEPAAITYHDDGTQTLVWVIEDHPVAKEVPVIHYSCDIDLDSASGTEYINTAIIQTTEDMRHPKASYGNEAVAVIKVHAPAMLVAKKKADRLFTDASSPLGFTLQWSNRSLEPYKQQIFMDSMPFSGDDKGSSYGGDYLVTGLKVTAPSAKPLAAYRCYYTLDQAAANMSAKDFTYTDFTGSSCSVGGIDWMEATIGDDGKVPALVGQKVNAWVLLGDLAGSESLSAHITMETDGNDAADVYVNKISVGTIDLNATTRLVQRQIAGVVWLDANYDGQRQASEKRLGGVLTKLLMKQSDGSWAPAVNVKGKRCVSVTTDDMGRYRFTNLPAGEFKVVFSSGEIQLDGYRAAIQKASGAAASVNSDAEGIYLGGVLDRGEITGIKMPETDDITSSPYTVNYQDFGLIEKVVPAMTYHDSMQNGDTVKAGDKINYKITYGNDDTTETSDIIITNVLDKGLAIRQNSISHGGTWQPDVTGKTGGTVTWTLKKVQPNTFDGYVTFSAAVNQNAAGDTKVENSAKLKYTYASHGKREYKTELLVNPLAKDEQPAAKVPAAIGHPVTPNVMRPDSGSSQSDTANMVSNTKVHSGDGSVNRNTETNVSGTDVKEGQSATTSGGGDGGGGGGGRTTTTASANRADSTAAANQTDSTASANRADSTASANRTDSTASTNRSDSTTPANRSDSTASANRADSTVSANLVDSNALANRADSTASTNRSDSTVPANRSDSTVPANRTDSTVPANRMDSTASANRSDSTASTNRSDSTAPTNLVDSTASANRSDSNTPTNPAAPTTPTNPAANPPVVSLGHTVVPTDPWTYIEYDKNGTMLGTWRLNVDNIWVFNREILLARLARTGDSRIIERMLLLLACLSMSGIIFVRRNKKKREN